MFKRDFLKILKHIGLSEGEASAELNMIMDALNIDSLKEIKQGHLSDEEIKSIDMIVKERVKTEKPLQQILGFGYFMGEKFLVNEHTLIPRPETEILVKECLKLIDKKSKILDIGTGSGCIAIEISKNSNAEVDAIDISEHALKIAKKNAKNHGVNCNFFISDLFSNVHDTYDFIVSNPPYIPISDKVSLDATVRDFEPHAALFAKDKLGLEFYKKIINDSVTFLNNNGYLAFELGIGQFPYVRELLLQQGFSNIKIFKDLNNIERVTIAQYF